MSAARRGVCVAIAATMPIHDIRLLPYGSARLRVAEMPVIVPAPGSEPVDDATG